MTLTPRHISDQNTLCRHDVDSGTAEAGAIVRLSGSSKVAKVTTTSGGAPFAMLGQKVKAQAAGLPQNFEFPGEMGTSDARVGDPVLLYFKGTFETTHYAISGTLAAGAPLYASTDAGKLTNVAASGALEGGSPKVCAIAQSSLSPAQASAAEALTIKLAL